MGKKRPPAFNKGAYAGHQHVIMPEKFLCRVCQKWKANSQYSNKELNKFIYFVARGSQLTPTTAKLRCCDCSGAPPLELNCLGPCGKLKPLDDFSKSARSAGGSNWCMICTLWKESSEHNVSVQAPPSQIDPDTQANLPSQRHSYEYSDPEVGIDGSDYDDEFAAAPSVVAPSMSEISYRSNNAAHQYNSGRTARVEYGRNYMANQDHAGSDSFTTTDSVAEYSQSSASNPWENEFNSSRSSRGRNQHSGDGNDVWMESGKRDVKKKQNNTCNGDKNIKTSERSKWAKPFGSRNAGRYYEAEQTSSSFQGLSAEHDSDVEDLIDL